MIRKTDSDTQDVEQIQDSELDRASGGGAFNPASELSKRGFNPQPEPPAIDPAADLKARGFNPQPEPPAVNKFRR